MKKHLVFYVWLFLMLLFKGTSFAGIYFNEAMAEMSGASLILAVETGNTVDTDRIVTSGLRGAAYSGSFATYEIPLNTFRRGGNCDNDDYPDTPFPPTVDLRFAYAPNGEIFIGVFGPDSDVLSVMNYGGGAAYYDTNDPSKIYHSHLQFDERANNLTRILYLEHKDHLWPKGYVSGPVLNNNTFWTEPTFDLYNGFDKSIFQVLVSIYHQQRDYSWYNWNRRVYEDLLMQSFSPAITTNQSMLLKKEATFSYENVVASSVTTHAYGDNGNWEEVWLDGINTGRQTYCGSSIFLFPDKTPENMALLVNSRWSSQNTYYWGTFVADNVSTMSYQESMNGSVNPENSFDQNPAPKIIEFTPGWQKTILNYAPIADAGSGTDYLIGEQVWLDGSQSTDPDGDMLSFHWLQSPSNPSPVDISDPTAMTQNFPIFTPGSYNFTLEVSDGQETDSDTITIVVGTLDQIFENANLPPSLVNMISGLTFAECSIFDMIYVDDSSMMGQVGKMRAIANYLDSAAAIKKIDINTLERLNNIIFNLNEYINTQVYVNEVLKEFIVEHKMEILEKGLTTIDIKELVSGAPNPLTLLSFTIIQSIKITTGIVGCDAMMKLSGQDFCLTEDTPSY